MQTNMLKQIYQDELNTIYYIHKTQFQDFCIANDVIDKLELEKEILKFDHLLLLDTAANEPEWAIVGIDVNGTQTYSVQDDEDGDLVIYFDCGLWGKKFEQFLRNIVENNTYSDEL